MIDFPDILDSGREILKRMAAVDNNVTIYPPNHPVVMEPASEICELLKPLFADRRRVDFNIVNSEIYIENHLLSEESIKYSGFIRMLMDRGVNNLRFTPEVSIESITKLFSLVNKKEEDGAADSLRKKLKRYGVTGISCEELVALDVAEDVYELKGEGENRHVSQSSYGEALDYMESMERDVLANRAIDDGSLNAVVSSLMGDFLSDRDAVIGLMSIKNYDQHVFHHSVNVAITCLLLSSKLSLPEDLVRTIGVSGLLHDIGKIKVPREILEKPGKLTEAEWTVISRHPIEGAQILMRYDNLGELPVLAALEHHAGNDLAGYPTLKGKKKPHVIGRIVGIADVYEAMTANRSYRPAHNVHQAVQVLVEGAGKQFDPLLLKLLLDTVGVFPPGSLVRLRSGKTAVVVEPNEGKPFCPKVRPLGEDGEHSSEEYLIDVAENPAIHAIVGIADSPEV